MKFRRLKRLACLLSGAAMTEMQIFEAIRVADAKPKDDLFMLASWWQDGLISTEQLNFYREVIFRACGESLP